MTRCSCFEADGNQCTREVSTKYCCQHQKCEALEAKQKAEKQPQQAKLTLTVDEIGEICIVSQAFSAFKRTFANISLDQVKTLNQTIRSDGAVLHTVPEDVIDIGGDFLDPYFNLYPIELTKDFREILLKYLLETGVDLRRGDIVLVKSLKGFGNHGRFIFNGQLIEELDREVDEYGSVPSTYLVIGEFPITYWHGITHHNGIVWFDPTPYKKLILDNIDDKKVGVTSFRALDGQIYEIIDNRQIEMQKTIPFAQALRNMTNPQDFESIEIYAHTKIKQNGRRLYLL